MTTTQATGAPTDLVEALEQWASETVLSSSPLEIASKSLVAALGAAPSLHSVWLTLAVVNRAMPTAADVTRTHRSFKGEGAAVVVARLAKALASGRARHRHVELVHDSVIVDVRHTSETDLATGIQRVARETVRRWAATRDITLVTWTAQGDAMRRLLPDERATALDGARPLHGSTTKADHEVLVPIGGAYILPELAAEAWRTERVAAMAEFGDIATSVIGFDTVPLTTAETVADGMPGAYARNLGAVARMDKVGAISEAAASEYRGWRRMLSSSGIRGPEVQSVLLAAEPGDCTAADEKEFAELISLGEAPLVLVVGSHEPRKNHIAVLQAAELAWREGLQFQLVFVGGNSWNSLDFSDAMTSLKAQGRRVSSVSALSDALLWAAYRMSRFTIFPSINEGFGLPVAESLASGVPVITSRYGSMKQIAESGGALTVDPRDDADLLRGIRSLLVDDDVYDRLKREAESYIVRPWDDYAEELWEYFIGPDGTN